MTGQAAPTYDEWRVYDWLADGGRSATAAQIAIALDWPEGAVYDAVTALILTHNAPLQPCGMQGGLALWRTGEPRPRPDRGGNADADNDSRDPDCLCRPGGIRGAANLRPVLR